MSSDPIIIGQGVSKHYLLGEREQYRALRDVLSNISRRSSTAQRQELWALKDVSFEVSEGEVLGIIGRNGAGKSTLLKILSRITTPTEGEIRMQGRVGSLLEVGSGFHPELTGTENVYMNGAILGMSKTEITSKLDDIVSFAEMEQFISTPVKHYSVGMFMRLAFAVAAHLDSEILIIDEVLAVGDAKFQARCLAKMGEVARSGRSVLFVSHNLEATQALCDRGLLLEAGRLVLDSSTDEVIDHYRRLAGVTTRSGDSVDVSDLEREGGTEARFATIDVQGRPPGSTDHFSDGGVLSTGDQLTFNIEIEASAAMEVASFGLTFGTEGGQMLLNLDWGDGGNVVHLVPGVNKISATIPRLQLAPGRYRLGLRLSNPVTTRIGSGAIDMLDPALVLQVDPPDSTNATVPPVLASPLSDRQRWVRQGVGSLVEGWMTVTTND